MPTFETNPDVGAIDIDGTLPIDVVANDTVDEGTPYIAFINGVAVAPGVTVTLASGALISTRGFFGSHYPFDELTYDPNGVFDDIGLSQVVDTFTYQLAVTTGFGPRLDFGDLTSGQYGMTFGGDGRSAQADVNGDGIADILLTASNSVRIIYGSSTGIVAAPADGIHGSVIAGALANDGIGTDVSSAGDVNGDGIEDLIVGASRGQAYIVFGNTAGFGTTFSLADLDGSNGFRLLGASGSHTGKAVSGGGDFNGDGRADLLVAADGASSDITDVYLVFGKSFYNTENVQLSNINGINGTRLIGADWRASVSFVGDVNDDGLDDVAISSANHGSVYILFGSASAMPASIDLTALAPTQGIRLQGESGRYAGYSVSGAGDVNGDGIDDFVIGAPDWFTYDYDHADAGAAYVVFGTAGGGLPADLSLLDGSNGFRIENDTAGRAPTSTATWLGHKVAGAGDVNGDGLDDIVVLTSEDAIVVYGSTAGFTPVVGTSSLNGANGFIYFSGVSSVDQQFLDLSGGRDINGDGFDDILIQGDYHNDTQVIFGRESTVELSDPETVQITVGGSGTDGDDHLIGLDTDETADVLAGNDYVEGRGGNDVIHGNTGDDHLLGGNGNDTLYGEDGADQLNGEAGDDVLDGGNGDNKLIGGAGNDQLAAGTGADTLSGQNGDDQLTGGGGNDLLMGGSGVDRMNGGSGADTFRFLTTDFATNPFHSRDIISGFSGANGDRVDLARIDAIAGGGDNAFAFIGDSAFSHVAGELRYSYVNNVTLIQGDWNGDGVSDMDIRLSGHIALAAGDFIL